MWRALDELSPACLKRVAAARAKTRARVWDLLPGGLPAARVADTTLPAGLVVLDVDATIVVAHSEKEHAAPTFKKTFGYHPIGVWCDNTGELLAARLRPGNAGSNTAADHTAVLTEAIAQIPARHRRNLLIRVDGAGFSHELVDWFTALDTAKTHGRRGRSVEYSVGFAVTEPVREALKLVPKRAWTPAMDADGDVREHADIVEITGLLPTQLTEAWPAGMRVIVRRERPHPGAQLSLFEHADGWRYQAFATNTTTGQLAFLEARHRAHARVEDGIRHAKDTGLGRFPSREYGINQTWLTLVMVAADLIAWTRLLTLTGDAAALATCEPKALPYRPLHAPARRTEELRRHGRVRQRHGPTGAAQGPGHLRQETVPVHQRRQGEYRHCQEGRAPHPPPQRHRGQKAGGDRPAAGTRHRRRTSRCGSGLFPARGLAGHLRGPQRPPPV